MQTLIISRVLKKPSTSEAEGPSHIRSAAPADNTNQGHHRAGTQIIDSLEPPIQLNRNRGALASCFDAFSLREPVPTSLSKCGAGFARKRSSILPVRILARSTFCDEVRRASVGKAHGLPSRGNPCFRYLSIAAAGRIGEKKPPFSCQTDDSGRTHDVRYLASGDPRHCRRGDGVPAGLLDRPSA